jgi:multiple sugar transport system permease protein
MATSQQVGARGVASARSGARSGFNFVPYLFILPHLLFFAAFLGWPFFYGIYISLFDFDFLSPDYRPFVGLDNYTALFDPSSLPFEDFWNALRNTATFVLYSVPPLVIVGLLLAVLLNGKFRGRNVFRAIYFAPWSLSAVVASLLWWWIFQDQGGLVNATLGTRFPWLGAQPGAWLAITTATVWWTVGFNTIIFLAALQDIPDYLYEAASLDGASTIRTFFSITLPMLRSVTVFVVTITLLASANLFAQPYVMTRGGPAQSTESIMMRIYNEGFGSNLMGSAAAMSVVVAAILLLLTVLNFKLFGGTEER